MKCRRWACAKCGPAMRNRLVWLAIEARPTTFMTLTCNPAPRESFDEAFRFLGARFGDLIQRLRRANPGEEIEYLAVWERTKKGWPHLHVLLRAPYLPQARISSLWKELTASPIVDIRAAHDPRRDAFYVAKYLTKEGSDFIPGRKWQASARFFHEPFRPTRDRPAQVGKWSVWRGDALELAMEWERQKLVVEMRAEGEMHARPKTEDELHPDAALERARTLRKQNLWRTLAGLPTRAPPLGA